MVASSTSSADVLAGFTPPVPPASLERALAFARDEHGPPVQPRRAASVVLLRDGPPGVGVETYLMHRHARMPFAASVAAFPGGGLDPVDDRAADPLLACALRETAEETTVRLGPDDLVRWARWVTPAYEARRYDTTFYLAVVPPTQEPQDVSGETDRAGWVSAAAALTDRAAGSLTLMPPTWSILIELAAVASVADLVTAAAARDVVTVVPRLVRAGDAWAFAYEVAG